MPNSDDVLINFLGDTSGLVPVENALDGIIAQSGEVGQAWAKTSAAINAGTKSNVDTTNSLAKSIEALGTATKSMDKVIIGGAYASYLKQIQAQLVLTNKEVVSYITNARDAARQSILSSQSDEEINQFTLSIEAMNDQLKVFGAGQDDAGAKSVNFSTQLRAVANEIKSIQVAIKEGTATQQQITDLDTLTKKYADLDRVQKQFGIETKGLVANDEVIAGSISLLSGLAGGFAVAQGASALFGDSNEEVQKALLKVNAAMSILQGLSEINAVLQKSSAASIAFNTAALEAQKTALVENAVAEATATATEAGLSAAEIEQAAAAAVAAAGQEALNLALSANPIGAVLIAAGALIAAFAVLDYAIGSSRREFEEHAAALQIEFDRLKALNDLSTQPYRDRIQQIENQNAVQKAGNITTAETLQLDKNLLEARKALTDSDKNQFAGDIKNAGDYNKQLTDVEKSIAALKLLAVDASGSFVSTLNDIAGVPTVSKSQIQDNLDALEKYQAALKAKYDNALQVKSDADKADSELNVNKTATDKFNYDRSLKDLIENSEARVAATRAGSIAERQAQIQSIKDTEEARNLLDPDLDEADKARIAAENAKEIAGIQHSIFVDLLKSQTAASEAELSKRKTDILASQQVTLQSIKDESAAEIAAIRARENEELKSNPNITPGERAKVIADANLQILELQKSQEAKLSDIRKAGINAVLLASQKGSQQEYDTRLQLIDLEQQKELEAGGHTIEQINEINATAVKARQDASRAFQEQQLANEISIDNAALDRFGITENEKLVITLKRLNEEEQIEISQAQGNVSKLEEIDAKYNKSRIDANKATINAILADNLKTLEVFNQQSQVSNTNIISNPNSSAVEKQIANDQLLKDAEFKTDLERDALEKQKLLLGAHEYNVALQVIENEEDANKLKHSQTAIQIFSAEQDRKLAILKNTIVIIQAGIDTLDTGSLKTGLTEVFNLYTKIGDAIAANAKVQNDVNATAPQKAASETAQRNAEITASIAAVQNTINQVFADAATQRQQQLTDDLAGLETQKNAELANKNLTEEQIAAINKKYANKEKAEKIKAFNADKEAKKEQAIINGFLAVTNALATAPTILAGEILAALVVVETAVQVASIGRTKPPAFKKGKVDIQGPGTTTSDSIPALISRGESVITADATSKWKDALKAMNANKFEHYLKNSISDFVYPHVPEDLRPQINAGHQIDYTRLAKEIAIEMKGIMPGHKSTHVNIDRNGIHTIVQDGNSRTEYKNKRYRMT